MIVIFDLDGTLIDSAPDIHKTANEVLAGEGLGPLDLPTVRSFIGHGVPHLVGRLLGAHGIADEGRAARMVSRFGARYEGAVGLTRLYPGAAEALAALVAQGHRLGLCTNKPVAPARAVMRHLGILDHFTAIIGGDSAPQRKPDPEPLQMAVAACGGGPAVYVGDSEVDAACAAAAEVPLIVHTEGYRKTPVEAFRPVAVFSDFAALPGIVAAQAEVLACGHGVPAQ
ncbi:phosphoglycolate phosphatase [Paracoccus endophyticus]|uniref:phosphoglycolate phosphatase n=1 Tax=Paracoccus endophyticus TaxID=2233774 RepID=UPI000DD8132E|nr:phosphoglycolate phosphatase [Paracoccus endophyticus]